MWTKEHIRDMVATNDAWLIRGILAIYKKQTNEEKNKEATVEDNGVGFNGVDAPFLSSLAKQLEMGRHLSSKQISIGRRMMRKYAGQLTRIANGSGS